MPGLILFSLILHIYIFLVFGIIALHVYYCVSCTDVLLFSLHILPLFSNHTIVYLAFHCVTLNEVLLFSLYDVVFRTYHLIHL